MTTSIRPDDPAFPEPVFAAPWEAKAFAMIIALHQRGLFPWRAFHEALAAEVARCDLPPQPESGSASVYYVQWMVAAEAVLSRLGIVDDAVIAGRAVMIRAELDAGDHDYEAATGPVAIAPARP
ncbi:MAG: nitrile hydratase accessory protein [Alphaproteobacteria bacterium]|nr:nitrile hydratase accessory protein [Alphaproteobacteria bacterium]